MEELTANQARELTEKSEGALKEAFKKAFEKIHERCLAGERKAWVRLPHEDLKEQFLLQLGLLGYTIGNTDGNSKLIEW